MSNGKGENAEKMDSSEDPSNTLQTIVQDKLIEEAKLIAEEKEKNKPDKEGNKNNKRRRPSEKDRDKEDKEDLPEGKKVKKSPKKKINLKKCPSTARKKNRLS